MCVIPSKETVPWWGTYKFLPVAQRRRTRRKEVLYLVTRNLVYQDGEWYGETEKPGRGQKGHRMSPTVQVGVKF